MEEGKLRKAASTDPVDVGHRPLKCVSHVTSTQGQSGRHTYVILGDTVLAPNHQEGKQETLCKVLTHSLFSLSSPSPTLSSSNSITQSTNSLS